MRRLSRLKATLEAWMWGQKGIVPSLFRQTMLPVSVVYAIIVKLRHLYYDSVGGVRASLPIVSVGNVVMGGVGKSDVVTALVDSLPKKVAILSRGYGVRIQRSFLVTAEMGAEVCGDEPRMLADRHPDALVIVGPNRVQSALLAKKLGAELILLDDGMQHRRLHRDFDILVTDRWPIKGRFLPSGNLRDDPKKSERADLIILTGSGAPPKEGCRMQERVEGVFDFQGKKVELVGRSVALFCGIANPHRFVETVKNLGVEVKATLFLSDHEKVDEEEVKSFLKQSGADYLLCTEKDRVKISGLLPILWVKRRLIVAENPRSWQNALDKIGRLS